MITLYGIPSSASTAPRICLEEAGAQYTYVRITRDPLGPPGFVEASPHGKVPALVDGEITMSESAAITMHLSDRFPHADLAPDHGDAARAEWYEWLMMLTTVVQAPLYQVIYPDRFTTDRLIVGRVRDQAARALGDALDMVEAHLSGDRRYLLGDRFSSADIFLFMLIPWTRHLVRPAFVRPHTAAYFARLSERPSIAHVVAIEGIV